MRIKVSIQNNSAINAELLKVNGRAESFTVTCTKQILEAIKKAEEKLAVLPKSQWQGIVFSYVPAGPSARSYKFNATSTVVRVERGASDWFLVAIGKVAVSPKERERLSIEISPDQSSEIQRRAVAEFYVIKPKA
jgi:hypothetical protein